MSAANLEIRVGHLEQALLKLCVAAMDLVSVVASPSSKSASDECQATVDEVLRTVRDAAEIVSGEHAPR
jgi:acetaldehyde dehydrogenase (acetylating)